MYVAGAFEGYVKLAGQSSYVAIGCTEDGWVVNDAHHSEPIKSDCFGQAPVDGIQRGTTTTVQLTYIEYDKAINAIFANRGGSASAGFVLWNVGKRASDLAFELVLVPTPGTNAEAQIVAGNAYIFRKVLVVGEVRTLLSSRLRKGPLSLQCYLNSSGLAYEITTKPGGIP